MTQVIDKTQYEASKIYDAFTSAITLPDMFSPESVDLVIQEIDRTLELYSDSLTEAEAAMLQIYVNYLQLVKSNNDEPQEQDEQTDI
jgi:hypothetical protein